MQQDNREAQAREHEAQARAQEALATPKSCPETFVAGRNVIRCWLTAGHEGNCK